MKTDAAFGAYRIAYGPGRAPDALRIANDDELVPLSEADGLTAWVDGNAIHLPSAPPELPENSAPRLWVVREADVVYAAERCAFGQTLQTGMIKHTNLTGGQIGYAGGELLFLENGEIVINGRSGRYPIRSAQEMHAVASAFKESGYRVWSMGFDEESGFPFPFVGSEPMLVA